MNVARIDSQTEFQQLGTEWSALQQHAATSVFQTWEWQFQWWKHYGAGRSLYLLIVRNPQSELLGVLPLYMERTAVLPGCSVRMLRMIGTGGDTTPDYLDAVVAPGPEQAAAYALLLGYLRDHQEEWDCLRLSDLADTSPFVTAARNWNGAARWKWQEQIAARISFLTLPATWDEYLGALGRDRRYTIRSLRKKFLALPGARFFTWEAGRDIDAAFSRLAALHHARWEPKGEDHAFSSDAYNGFHLDVMRACHARGWLRIHCMELADEIIAMYYCYAWRGTTYYFQGGFDPRHERLRPGLSLMGYAIEQAIAEGQQHFDMLRGEYEYKKQWARETRVTLLRVCHRPGLATSLYRMRLHALPRVKRSIKSLLGRA